MNPNDTPSPSAPPTLQQLLDRVTDENRHAEFDFGPSASTGVSAIPG